MIKINKHNAPQMNADGHRLNGEERNIYVPMVISAFIRVYLWLKKDDI